VPRTAVNAVTVAEMENKNYILGHHLVAFLDVLGQREKFKGLQLPTNAHEEEHVKGF
jgi:hypothetical protein